MFYKYVKGKVEKMKFLKSKKSETVFFENNEIGQMKKKIFDASPAEIDQMLAEFGCPAESEL